LIRRPRAAFKSLRKKPWVTGSFLLARLRHDRGNNVVMAAPRHAWPPPYTRHEIFEIVALPTKRGVNREIQK